MTENIRLAIFEKQNYPYPETERTVGISPAYRWEVADNNGSFRRYYLESSAQARIAHLKEENKNDSTYQLHLGKLNSPAGGAFLFFDSKDFCEAAAAEDASDWLAQLEQPISENYPVIL